MINWNYNPEEVSEQEFSIIPIGNHRVRISEVEQKISSNGNDMIVLTLDVSGQTSKIWYNLVFLKDNQKITNSNLYNIYISFDIPIGNLDINTWVGKMGAARIKHELYNGENKARVSYFIKKDNQKDLPQWKETSTMGKTQTDFVIADDTVDCPY